MRRLSILETSKSLSDLISSRFTSIGFKVEVFTNALEGIAKILKNPPDLVIISSNNGGLRCSDILEFLKNDENIKEVPIIVYSTITNPMNMIFFDKADLFINKDLDSIEKLINGVNILLKEEKNLPNSRIITENEILLGLDLIYQNRDIMNNLRLKILDLAFAFGNPIDMVNSSLDFLLKNFDIVSAECEVLANPGISVFLESPSLKCLDYKTNEILISRKIVKIKLLHIIDNELELYAIKEIIEVLLIAINNNYNYIDNVEMSLKLNRLFKNFLPEKVVDDLINRKNKQSLMTGEKREVAVIFSHIKNFNTIEESLPPEDVVNFLNNHFTGISNVIKERGGEINKFIKDAVFAMVGAPLSFTNNEERAVCAAIEMIKYVDNSQEKYNIGVGVHIGKAIIGNIGSEDNFDYTAIGDTINLTARLESLCKYYQVDILVSDEIYSACIYNSFGAKFLEIDNVFVQGKNDPTAIYEVYTGNKYPTEFVNCYTKGIKMFKLGNWNLALDYFLECNAIYPKNKLITIYLERCNLFIQNPPKEWSGAIKLGFK